MRVALAFGRAQACLAADFREGGMLVKCCVFPPWLVCRFMFLALFALAVARIR